MLLKELLEDTRFDRWNDTGYKQQDSSTRKNKIKQRRVSNNARFAYKAAIRDEGQLEWMKDRVMAFMDEYGCSKTAKLIQKWYDEDRIDEDTARELLSFCDFQNPAHRNIDPLDPEQPLGKYELE